MKKICLIINISLLLSSTILGGDDDPEIGPGASFRLEFPDEQETLAGGEASMAVQLPPEYSKDEKYPLFLWLGGGNGGNGNTRSDLIDSERYICIGLPLFRKASKSKSRKKKKAKDKGVIAALHLRYQDAKVMWGIYEKMFKRLEELVPNIEKKKGVAAGFSNGAHAIAILMTKKPKEFREYFGAFVFVEGGYMLKKKSAFRKCPIVGVGGETSWGKKKMSYDGSSAYDAKSFVKKNSRKKTGKLIIMKKTGHSFNAEYVPEIKEWLEKQGF